MPRIPLLAPLALVLLAACGSPEGGQVAAIVNGEEITFQEINAEMRSLRLTGEKDELAAQRTALEKIIERKLAAQEARAQGIDRSPDYLLRERQLQDALLVRMLDQQTEGDVAVPDDQATRRFIERNPQLFAERRVLLVEQIEFASPGRGKSLSRLADAASLDEVAARLGAMDIAFERGTARHDAFSLGQARIAQLLALPQGKPFVVAEGGRVTIGAVRSVETRPIAGETAERIATDTLRERQYERSLQTRAERLRSAASIEYREGFGPPEAEDEEEANKADTPAGS